MIAIIPCSVRFGRQIKFQALSQYFRLLRTLMESSDRVHEVAPSSSDCILNSSLAEQASIVYARAKHAFKGRNNDEVCLDWVYKLAHSVLNEAFLAVLILANCRSASGILVCIMHFCRLRQKYFRSFITVHKIFTSKKYFDWK